MSDLSHCGCDSCCENGTGLFSGNGSCACNIIWIILILSILGNGSNGISLFGNGSGENCSCTALIWILLLSCCCGGNGIF